MNIKSILAVVLISIGTFSAAGQSVDSIGKIRQAQDMVVDRIVSSLNNTNSSNSVVAAEVKDLADGVLKLQKAETQAYHLTNTRDMAPQIMTAAAIERSLAEAKELGVSRSLRNNMRQEWEHARSLVHADRVIASVNGAIRGQISAVTERGSVRRFLPEFLGGTSSYANHCAPQLVEANTALAGKVTEMEKRLALLTAPTMTK